MFWYGLIVALCYVPGWTGAYIPTQWPVLAILLSFALWRSGPFTALHAAMAAFVLYAAASLIWSPVLYASVFGLWLIVIFAMALWFGTAPGNLRELYGGLTIGCAVWSLVAIFQFFGSTAIPRVTGTPAGLAVNSIQLGAVLALLIVALATERMWLWIVPLVPGFVLAQSRGAWLALAIGLAATRFRKPWVFLGVAAAGAAILFSPWSSSDTERLFIWRVAWDNLSWLGYGVGSFYTVTLSRGGLPFHPEYAHNDALQLAFEFGVGALLIYAVFAYALARPSAKEWPIVATFVTLGCYSMPLFMPVASFLAFAVVGRILRNDALAGRLGYYGRQSFVPGPHRNRVQGFSMASHHQAKG